MEKNFSKIKLRVLEYAENKGFSKRRIYSDTGLSNGVLDKPNGLSEDGMEKIISTYPDINPEWLLTGRGSMLREQEEVTHSAEKVMPSERDELLEERLRSLERENELLRKMVDLLEKSHGTGDSDQMGGAHKQVG